MGIECLVFLGLEQKVNLKVGMKMNGIINEINKLEQEVKVCLERSYDMDTSFIGDKLKSYLVENEKIIKIKQLCQKYNIRDFDFDCFNGTVFKFILGNRYQQHNGEIQVTLIDNEDKKDVKIYTNFLVDFGKINSNLEEFTLSRNCTNIDLMKFYDLLHSNIDDIINTLYHEIRRKLEEERLRLKTDIEFFKEFKQKYNIGE